MWGLRASKLQVHSDGNPTKNTLDMDKLQKTEF